MAVLNQRFEPLPEEESPGVQRDTLGPIDECERNENLIAADIESLIAIVQPFSLQVGVDRHLGVSPSTDRGNEVESDRPAAASHRPSTCFGDGKREAHQTSLRVSVAAGCRLRRGV